MGSDGFCFCWHWQGILEGLFYHFSGRPSPLLWGHTTALAVPVSRGVSTYSFNAGKQPASHTCFIWRHGASASTPVRLCRYSHIRFLGSFAVVAAAQAVRTRSQLTGLRKRMLLPAYLFRAIFVVLTVGLEPAGQCRLGVLQTFPGHSHIVSFAL